MVEAEADAEEEAKAEAGDEKHKTGDAAVHLDTARKRNLKTRPWSPGRPINASKTTQRGTFGGARRGAGQLGSEVRPSVGPTFCFSQFGQAGGLPHQVTAQSIQTAFAYVPISTKVHPQTYEPPLEGSKQ